MSELNKAHIETLVTEFYQRVRQDELLAPIFNEVAQVDWEQHIPLLCQFWNSIMLKTNEYHGSAYLKHVLLGQQADLHANHFERWLDLFQEEAMKHLPPLAAQEITHKAQMIAESLKAGVFGQHVGLILGAHRIHEEKG